MEDFIIELIGGAAELVFDIVLEIKNKYKRKKEIKDNDVKIDNVIINETSNEYGIEE